MWCADYKGESLLGNHRYCYPLTVTRHELAIVDAVVLALRDAGSEFLIEDDRVFASPPLRAPAWEGDLEAALDEHREHIEAHVLAMKRDEDRALDRFRERLRQGIAKLPQRRRRRRGE